MIDRRSNYFLEILKQLNQLQSLDVKSQLPDKRWMDYNFLFHVFDPRTCIRYFDAIQCYATTSTWNKLAHNLSSASSNLTDLSIGLRSRDARHLVTFGRSLRALTFSILDVGDGPYEAIGDLQCLTSLKISFQGELPLYPHHLESLRSPVNLQLLNNGAGRSELPLSEGLADMDFTLLFLSMNDLRDLSLNMWDADQITPKMIFTLGKACRKLKSFRAMARL
ncbi:hypothetical protein K470DRAFT_266823 [Piedraia hortae CBS 480.64]|uniref:L domain-like protein n=1 Tax=Piedraia hortae CBS 480.64 TaxID=1314780 RepID=A0A6A7BRT0_9PEZI|nr:hypothetical protein K470DRAFT_266823 [Piedraia hortae CBS 480.64]